MDPVFVSQQTVNASVAAKGEATTLSMQDWTAMMNSVATNPQALHEAVMNYLVVEGHCDVAREFQKEAEIDPGMNLNEVAARTAIRNAIQSGDIVKGVELVNELNPEILDNDEQLAFDLQQQRLIELIRSGNLNGALDFARDEMATRGRDNPELMSLLESTMALLAFAPNAVPAALQPLLSIERRLTTATRVNAAVLKSRGQFQESRLPTLARSALWSESELARAKVAHPTLAQLLPEFFATPQQ